MNNQLDITLSLYRLTLATAPKQPLGRPLPVCLKHILSKQTTGYSIALVYNIFAVIQEQNYRVGQRKRLH